MDDHVGDHRLSFLGGLVTASSRTGSRRGVVVAASLVGAATLLVGCAVVPGPSPSPTPPPRTSAASPAPRPPSSTSQATDPTAAASPEPGQFDPLLVTQICEAWGPNRPDGAIRCGPAVEAALAALGSGAVDRVEFRYSPLCRTGPGCPDRRPDRAWVVVRARPGDVAVMVTVGGSDLVVGPPLSAPAAVAPAFRSPVARRARIDGEAPPEVRKRPPFPLCGVEQGDGRFDAAGRRCFLDGVLAGQPVEFLRVAAATEGGEALTLYRFAGRGGIVSYTRDAGRWTRTTCGIAPQATDVVFLLDGLCEREELDS